MAKMPKQNKKGLLCLAKHLALFINVSVCERQNKTSQYSLGLGNYD